MHDLFRQSVINYCPFNEQEEKDRKLILEALNEKDIFLRSNLIHHMTASSWVLNKTHDKVLMAYHNIYDSWAWLGGHADGNEDLLAVAIKEVKEESGLKEVKVLSNDIYSLEVLCVNGHMKKGAYVPSHLHLNVTYLLEADENDLIFSKADENSAVGWFSLEEALEKSTEPWFVENVYKKLNAKLKK